MSVQEISRRLVENVTALARGLAERGWKIATPEPFCSGILAAIPPGGDARKVAKELESRGIIASPREGAVRFSPHAYNDDSEVERIHSAVDASGSG
jgi:selenocysteine lyase/cysteine desulfurase